MNPFARNLIVRIGRRLAEPPRCEHPHCADPATFYDAALDARTCPAHKPEVART